MAETHRCNLCGKEFDFWDEQGAYELRKRIGYGSEHDGDWLELRLCCACVDDLISACAVPPIREMEEWK